jgi:hypothetical protein
MVKGQLGKSMRPYLKSKKGGGVAWVVECLPGKDKVLSSMPIFFN